MTRQKLVCVRYDKLKLHVAVRFGNQYITACGDSLTGIAGRDLWLYTGRQAVRAWHLELQCLRCHRKVNRAKNAGDFVKASRW